MAALKVLRRANCCWRAAVASTRVHRERTRKVGMIKNNELHALSVSSWYCQRSSGPKHNVIFFFLFSAGSGRNGYPSGTWENKAAPITAPPVRGLQHVVSKLAFFFFFLPFWFLLHRKQWSCHFWHVNITCVTVATQCMLYIMRQNRSASQPNHISSLRHSHIQWHHWQQFGDLLQCLCPRTLRRAARGQGLIKRPSHQWTTSP